jgi:hypothetical protein
MGAIDNFDSFGIYMGARVEAAVHRAVQAEREDLARMAERAAEVHGGAAAVLRLLAADFRARGGAHG